MTFATAIEKLVREALPTIPSEQRQQIIRMHFVNGLRPTLKQKILTSLPAASYQEAFAVAKNVEAVMALTQGVERQWGQTGSGVSSDVSHRVFAGFAVKQSMGMEAEIEQLRKQVEKLSHSAGKSNSSQHHRWSSTGKPICGACGHEGHIRKFCRGKQEKKGNRHSALMHCIQGQVSDKEDQVLTILEEDETELEVLRRQVKAYQDRERSRFGF